GAGDVRDMLATTGSPGNADMGVTVIDNTLTPPPPPPPPPPLGGVGGSVSVCSHVSRSGLVAGKPVPPKRTMVRRAASVRRNSRQLTMLAAIRRASSRVSSLAADRRPAVRLLRQAAARCGRAWNDAWWCACCGNDAAELPHHPVDLDNRQVRRAAVQ